MDKLNTIAELDSTGSLLSDLSCFSKSEDDLDTSVVIQQNQKKREWKEHRPSGEYSAKKRRSSMQKVVDLNISDRIVATTTVVLPKDGPITASSVIEAVPGNENQNPNTQSQSTQQKNRRSADHLRQKIPNADPNNPLIEVEVRSAWFTLFKLPLYRSIV